MGLSRNKVAVSEGAAGLPPFKEKERASSRAYVPRVRARRPERPQSRRQRIRSQERRSKRKAMRAPAVRKEARRRAWYEFIARMRGRAQRSACGSAGTRLRPRERTGQLGTKRKSARGGCLGIDRRRRTRQAAKIRGEAQAAFDPRESEWENPSGSDSRYPPLAEANPGN